MRSGEKNSLGRSAYARKMGHRLYELRKDRDLSQEQVAHEAGISTYTYQKYEKGESRPGTPMNPCLFTLVALSEVFEVDITALFDFE